MSNAGPGVRLKVNRLADWTSPAYRIQRLESPISPHKTSSDDLYYQQRKSDADSHAQRMTYGSLWAESAALAYMATAPYDVRPHLLLMYFGQVSESTEAAIAYGRRYLVAWCKRMDIGRKWGFATPFAAADALAVLYWGRSTRGGDRVPIGQRALSLHISRRDYSVLREKALDVYRLRLAEAIVQFERSLTRMEIYAPGNLHTQGRNTGLPARNSEHLARRAA
jgi:hypothetical protein